MIQKHCFECGAPLIEKELEGEGIVPFCPQCQEFRFPMYNVAVSMIVINEQTGEILLIKQYGRPFFILVAGYVNRGEPLEHAVGREIKEETGMTVSHIKFNRTSFFEPSNTLMCNFTAFVKDASELSPNTEIDSYQWFTPAEAQKNIRPNSLAERFLNAYLEAPKCRPEGATSKTNLLFQAFTKFFLGVILLGTLVFLPAGSFHYWQGWLLMGVLFIPMFIAGLVMMVKNPELLRKRLNAKEQEKEQKTVVALSGLLFIAAFVVAGLNWRFQWCVLPNWVVWVAAALFLLCYGLYAEVLRENTYLSRTIEVQEHQKVIDTGLYGVVRHPMYMATTVLFLMMPLVLASPISFAIMLLYIPLIAKRIRNEEAVLEQGLEGYGEYKQRVKYKVLPFIW